MRARAFQKVIPKASKGMYLSSRGLFSFFTLREEKGKGGKVL
jgi:hypothetical protein